MDEKQKNSWFWTLLSLAILLTIAFSFIRFFIAKGYPIVAEIDCDPTAERCFIYECDSETEECTGDPEQDTWYYKKMTRQAVNIALCDPNDPECTATKCFEEEEGCSYQYCDENMTEEEGGVCSDPETYTAEHSAEKQDERGENSEIQEAENESGNENENVLLPQDGFESDVESE